MAKNEFEFEILEDGMVKVTTGKFDAAVHMSADAFLAWSQKELGGEVKVAKGAHSHTHSHERGHDHDHDHEHVGGKK